MFQGPVGREISTETRHGGGLVPPMRTSAFAHGHSLKLGSYPPTENGGPIFLMTAFQKDGSQVFKKDIPWL